MILLPMSPNQVERDGYPNKASVLGLAFCVNQENLWCWDSAFVSELLACRILNVISSLIVRQSYVLCLFSSQPLYRIFGQRLTGTLPTELAALPSLHMISVPYNKLTGTLPPEYASIKQLVIFEVHGNSLTGSIPVEYFGNHITTALARFNFGVNLLSGSLDTRIGLMNRLESFWIFENNLEGNFPTEVGNLRSRHFSRVHGNKFIGPVPTKLGRLTLLNELWYHGNAFTGTWDNSFRIGSPAPANRLPPLG
jgi:hypothetical protein